MRWTLQLRVRLLGAAAFLGTVSCGGDDITAPTTGSLEIRTATTGPEPDPDGYVLSIDEGAEIGIGVNATHLREDLEPGNHRVRLGGISANCSVAEENPRPVSVEAGANVSVNFTVTCGPTTGSLGVTAATSGPSPDADGYTVTVDGTERGPVAISGGISLDGVAPGDHLVGLNGVAGNCAVQEDNPRTITVTAGGSTSVAFVIVCAAPPPNAGSIRIITNTAGADPDPDGYAFVVDGGASQPIGASATTTLTNMAAGAHSVRLSRVATNCSVQGANPRPVTVWAGGTAEVSFAISCTAATGSLEIMTTTSGSSPDADGYTVAIDNGAVQAIGISATLTVPGVTPGTHQVTLGGMASNCRVDGDNPRAITVDSGATARLGFNVTCSSPPQSSSKIAFLSTQTGTGDPTVNLYVMNPDGSGVRKLTVGQEVVHLDWSPDGSRIVFDSHFEGDIYVIRPDGTGAMNLTKSPGIAEREPDWSPDGSRIAYWIDGNIHVMNSDGSGARKLVDGGADGWTWSPDGSRIAFLRSRPLEGHNDIYLVNVDGSGETNLTNNPANKKYELSWSPDGRKIGFTSDPFRDIYVMNPDGSGQTQLTNNPATDGNLAWSPDGGRIAFVSDRDRLTYAWEIYVMGSDGSNQTNLTNTPADPDSPDYSELVRGWSPDGGKILYERFGTIWVMNADGSDQTDLKQRGTDSAWSP